MIRFMYGQWHHKKRLPYSKSAIWANVAALTSQRFFRTTVIVYSSSLSFLSNNHSSWKLIIFVFVDSADTEVNESAKRTLVRLSQKLRGVEKGTPLSVRGQVNLLIQQATDPANLYRIFHGWRPQAWLKCLSTSKIFWLFRVYYLIATPLLLLLEEIVLWIFCLPRIPIKKSFSP